MTPAHTHKSEKIARLLPPQQDGYHPTHYRAYFICFDQQLYYEAHDVLEELWLGCRGLPEYDFFKGLIQLAGSFVHLQKHRLAPAARLYDLAWQNLKNFGDNFLGLNLKELQTIVQPYRDELGKTNRNPLEKLGPPRISGVFNPKSRA